MTWSIERIEPLGSTSSVLVRDGMIEGLDFAEVTEYGGCLDATLIGRSVLGLSHRDGVVVKWNGVAIYSGMVVSTPNPNSFERSEFRMVGLTEKLKEILVQVPIIQTPSTREGKGRVNAHQAAETILLDFFAKHLCDMFSGFVNNLPTDLIIADTYKPNYGNYYDILTDIVGRCQGYVFFVDANRVINIIQRPTYNPAAAIDYAVLPGVNVTYMPSESATFVNRVTWIAGWTTDKARAGSEALGSSYPVTHHSQSQYQALGVSAVVKQVDQKAPPYKRITNVEYVMHTGTITDGGFAALYDELETTSATLDGDLTANSILPLQILMRVPASEGPVGFKYKLKVPQTVLWSARDDQSDVQITTNFDFLSGIVFFGEIDTPPNGVIEMAFAYPTQKVGNPKPNQFYQVYAPQAVMIHLYPIALDRDRLDIMAEQFYVNPTNTSASVKCKGYVQPKPYGILNGVSQFNTKFRYRIMADALMTTEITLGDRFNTQDAITSSLIQRKVVAEMNAASERINSTEEV